MKILYAIQGTGNGHVSRARDVVPFLQNFAEVDVLVSAKQYSLTLPFQIHFEIPGFTFFYNKNGGLDYYKSWRKNSIISFVKQIRSIDVSAYDLVISDFEPISAWACKLRKVPCIGLSHQASFLSSKVPRPVKKSLLGEFILKYFVPVKRYIGFHFSEYDKNIFPPLIRKEVQSLKPVDNGHYTVYLPAYGDDELIGFFAGFPEVNWHIFSKNVERTRYYGHMQLESVSNSAFLESLASCSGLITSAGFESPSEALYLRKKVLVVPIQGQYEQECNAVALQKWGVPMLKKLSGNEWKLQKWIEENDTVIAIKTNDDWQQKLVEIIGECLVLKTEASVQ